MQLLKIFWLVLFSLALSLNAQTTIKTNVFIRPISLEESIELALKHNLNVQISHLDINVARFDLGLVYAAWEPVFAARASHSFNSTPSGTFDPQGRAIPSSERT